jgi:hypothetical protein
MTEARPPHLFKRFHRYLIEWNVFKSDDQQDGDEQYTPDPRLLREQRIATRVYIISMTSE